MKKLLLAALPGMAFLVMAPANAAYVELQNVTVESINYHVIGSDNNYLEVVIKEPIPAGNPAENCLATKSKRIFSHWGNPVTHHQYFMSLLASAEAQGKKVDLKYDNASCHANSGWLLMGVRLHE